MRNISMTGGLAAAAQLYTYILYICVCACIYELGVYVYERVAGDATLLCRGVNANYHNCLTCVMLFEEVISCHKQQ